MFKIKYVGGTVTVHAESEQAARDYVAKNYGEVVSVSDATSAKIRRQDLNRLHRLGSR